MQITPALWVPGPGSGHIWNDSQPNGTTMYWSAPGPYCGQKLQYAGGVLRFDMIDSPETGGFAREDVMLKGADQLLVFTLGERPGASWRRFTVRLSPAGWKVGTLAGPTATLSDFHAVMANLVAIYIRGEFQLGPDARGLDNVRMTCEPVIVGQPTSSSVCRTGSVLLQVMAVGEGLQYQWAYENEANDWVNLSESTVVLAGGEFDASGTQTQTLQVSLRVQRSVPPIRFRCIVTNSCGSVTSEPATLVPCQSDLNCDNLVDDADFVVFAAAYNLLDCADPAMASGCRADLNGDGFVDDSDFVLFVTAYNELGCL
ncbi:MAG: hypothetical protein JNM86_09295 [Phycisphaerae bacterium]|nr:hypothetical protein [Phycisphaerae bacterium]